MSHESLLLRRRLALLLAASSWCALSAFGAPAVALTPAVPPVAGEPAAALVPKAPASQNVTINLINRLVERGVLPKEDAVELIQLAEADAAEARAQAAATQDAVAKASAAQQSASQAVEKLSLAPDLAPTLPASDDDTVRVTYIPEVVKKQMRDQIKADVMAEAREQHWVAPDALPEWVTRFKVFGDVRVRSEWLLYPDGNDNTGAFPNFNAINTGAPFDVSGNVFSPQLNVDQDRQRIRLRARVGAEVDLGEGFSAGLRLATGENNSPVTTNQSLGLANQSQGGNFSKYAIWLDRAFIKYEFEPEPNRGIGIVAGRFDNPFFSTDIIWDEDVGFDGFAVQGKYATGHGLTPFFTAGAFPVFNTDLNFSSNQPAKFKSTDKWLYAAQIGTDWKASDHIALKVGAGLYEFDNVEGRLSDPFTPQNASDAGNTDNTRPSFAQRGNTYRPLRDIVPNASNNFGTTNQFQYFGLATPFRELSLTARLDFSHFEPFHIAFIGEYVKNLAFDSGDIGKIAVNNRGPDTATGVGSFDGGDTAWILGVKVGSAVLQKRWDWNVGVNYRHVESDSLIDGFTDSDFGVGGTNIKGFTLSGAVALSSRVWVGIRWMSADSISGPPFKNDTLQIDLNARF